MHLRVEAELTWATDRPVTVEMKSCQINKFKTRIEDLPSTEISNFDLLLATLFPNSKSVVNIVK